LPLAAGACLATGAAVGLRRRRRSSRRCDPC
jgi:LPXTG-motif cell wall-anchored protein